MVAIEAMLPEEITIISKNNRLSEVSMHDTVYSNRFIERMPRTK